MNRHACHNPWYHPSQYMAVHIKIKSFLYIVDLLRRSCTVVRDDEEYSAYRCIFEYFSITGTREGNTSKRSSPFRGLKEVASSLCP